MYFTAFSIRFEKASVSLTSSISPTTSRKLSKVTSIFLLAAIGFILFNRSSKRALILTWVIFNAADFLSIFTRVKRSFIILLSLSISSTISVMNSRYISFGTSSCKSRESASTFMEVIGVFSSCDTFETNSCLDSSNTCILLSNTLNDSVSSANSWYLLSTLSFSRCPSFNPEIWRFNLIIPLTDNLLTIYAPRNASIKNSMISIFICSLRYSFVSSISFKETVAIIAPLMILSVFTIGIITSA